MKQLIPVLSFALFLGVLHFAGSATAQEQSQGAFQNLPPDEFSKARVVRVVDERAEEDPFVPTADQYYQVVEVIFLDGEEKGSSREVTYYPGSSDSASNLEAGDRVVVMKSYGVDRPSYVITDRYRLPSVGYIALVFLCIVILLTGIMGLRSLAGLGFSIVVILWYMIPSILAGQNPLLVSLLGAAAIAVVSIYLAHGFKLRTSLALVSTLITITLSVGLAMLAVQWAQLFGMGSEEALYIQLGQTATINLRGLLLGGIIVGLLGVLDDITTAQAAVVDELKKANKQFSFVELFTRGFSVGKEHIASLINTLALAYVGSSLPLLILFSQYKQPLPLLLNSEIIAEEIIRTVVGSTALVLAVPITTALAAYVFTKRKARPSKAPV